VLLDGREHSHFTVDVVRLRRDLGIGAGIGEGIDRPGGHPKG
jgi:hypothetical protein